MSRERRLADLVAKLEQAEAALRDAADGLRELRELAASGISKVAP